MGSLGLSVFGTLILGLFARWIVSELSVHGPLWKFFLRRAVNRLPETERAALLAEWTDIVQRIKSPTLQLINAASYFFSADAIRKELEAASRANRGRVFFEFERKTSDIPAEKWDRLWDKPQWDPRWRKIGSVDPNEPKPDHD
jgi:hypothetical protein